MCRSTVCRVLREQPWAAVSLASRSCSSFVAGIQLVNTDAVMTWPVTVDFCWSSLYGKKRAAANNIHQPTRWHEFPAGLVIPPTGLTTQTHHSLCEVPKAIDHPFWLLQCVPAYVLAHAAAFNLKLMRMGLQLGKTPTKSSNSLSTTCLKNPACRDRV